MSSELSKPGAASTTYGIALTTSIAVDVGAALDVDAIGRVAVRGRPVRCDVSCHADDVLKDDRLAPVDHPRRPGTDSAAGARRHGAERHLDVAVGQLTVQ